MEETTSYYLNTTPCQFTVSKTKQAMKYINHLEASRCEPNSINGVHHMTIILTNNSHIEGSQWKIRLKDDKGTRNVSILSSDRQRAHFNDANSFLGYCTQINKPDDLVDTLVVCNNSIRLQDLCAVIDTFYQERIDLTNIGINKCIFTVMFDEVDRSANLTNACEFIEYTRNNKLITCIDSIHLITATPYDDFWKQIKKVGFSQLKNLRYQMNECPSAQQMIADYRQLEDHNIVYVESTLESDKFIKDIYERYISNNQGPIRLFAPPNKYTDTHESIKQFFLKKKWIVVIINGKSKDIHLPEETLSIDHFNRTHISKKADVEMYKTLSKLHQLYSNTNIVITGFNCIERGVTFQTDGFNFTDMIIPPIRYTKSASIASCVQLLGRANGGKKYVQKHNIYIQEENYTKIKERIDYALKLIESNPIKMTETDFREKTTREKDMVRWEVPISIDLQRTEFEYITEKKGIRFSKDRTKSLFTRKDIDIEGYDSAMWNNPVPENAYNKNIIPLLNAISNNEKICLLHKRDKNKNKKLYSVYFDSRNYKVILMKYNGNIIIE